MALWQFGAFQLDSDAGELFRQGRRVRLSGQPSRVLSLLVATAGRIVTREELREHVWGRDRFVEFDKGLNFCIACIRDALGDDARSPRFVETIPRRGYRFIADVRLISGESAVAPHVADRRPLSLAHRLSIVTAAAALVCQLPVVQRAHTRATTNTAARLAFERADAEAGQGNAGRRRSIRSYREAARLDPRFAEAHFAIADTYMTLAADGDLPVTSALREARYEAETALALEDVVATRLLRGTIRLAADWDWTGARRDLEDAVGRAPAWDGGLVAYARFLSAAGEAQRAVETIDRAETINPSCDLLLWESARIRYQAGRDAEALEKLRLAEQFGPPRAMAADEWRDMLNWFGVFVDVHREDWSTAWDRIAPRHGRPAIGLVGASAKHAVLTYLSESADAMARAARPGRRLATAAAYAAAGRTDEALPWLARAVADHEVALLSTLRDPVFERLRHDRRFDDLVGPLHLPAAAPSRVLPHPATRSARVVSRLIIN